MAQRREHSHPAVVWDARDTCKHDICGSRSEWQQHISQYKTSKPRITSRTSSQKQQAEKHWNGTREQLDCDMSTHTVARRNSGLKVSSTVIQCLRVHSLRTKHSSSLATNWPSHKGYYVSHWMWSRRERGPCYDVARVLGTPRGRSTSRRLLRSSNDWVKCKRGSKSLVACILVQKARGRKPRRGDEILCFVSFSNTPVPLFFVPTRCVAGVTVQSCRDLFLCNHCRVGTFIRIDFCVFSPFLFQLQSSEVWCFRTSGELFKVILQDRAFVASLGSVVLTASLLHAHLIAAWAPRYAYSPLRSRATARAQRVTNHSQW